MPEYQEIKNELSSIAEILKQYPESLQGQVFKILIERYLGETVELDLDGEVESQGQTSDAGGKSQAVRKKQPSKENYGIVKDLDLVGNADRQSFRDFCEQKSPGSALDFNAVAVYYLQRIMNVQGITLDHIYTCYKNVSRKMPGAFKQSVWDTSSRTGCIDTKDMNNITITVVGENFVEHDLPKKKEQEKAT